MTRRRLSVLFQPLLDFFILVRDDDGRSVPFSSCAKQPRGNDGEWSAKEERLVSFFGDLKNSRSVDKARPKCRIEISRERPWFINSQSMLVFFDILSLIFKTWQFFGPPELKSASKCSPVINHTRGSFVLGLDNWLRILLWFVCSSEDAHCILLSVYFSTVVDNIR